MIYDQKFAERLLAWISSHKDFVAITSAVMQNCYGPVYLVGGKVYRSIAEIVHGGNFGSDSADWDFLCLGDVKANTKPMGFKAAARSYYTGTTKSLTYKRYVRAAVPWAPPSRRGLITRRVRMSGPISALKVDAKVDIIAIDDIISKANTTKTGLDAYFDGVPLDIQALALGPICAGAITLKGPLAISAIERRKVSINNKTGLLPNYNIPQYIKDKAATLPGFVYEGMKAAKIACNCFPNDLQALWREGCQMPRLHY